MEDQETVVLRIKELDPDIIAPSTANMNKPDQGGSKIALVGRPGCFAEGTLVLMYDGTTKPVEDVQLGDRLMGDDSTSRLVVNLCRGKEDMYKIVPMDGGKPIVVNESHILLLKKGDDIIEVEVREYLKKTAEGRLLDYKWYRTAVEFARKPVSVDPYLVGMWIGGVFSEYFIKTASRVPKDIMINSSEVRRAFLTGLIDHRSTDMSFYPKELLADIEFVANSLGFVISPGTKLLRGDFESLYKKDSVSRSRKSRYDVRVPSSEEVLETPFDIEYEGEDDFYGFTLDGNHRFLLSDFSVVRNSGKSSAIAALLYAKKHIFPVGMVMSGTEDTTGFFKRIFPSLFVYNSYEEEKVRNFIERQKIAKEHLDNPWAILLVDDCTENKKIFNAEIQHELFKLGRHYKLLYLLSTQHAMDFPSAIRTSIDGAFIFREPLFSARKSIWENYASVIPKEYFNVLMDKLTDDHTAIYVHNSTTANDWLDCVFWYKAPLVPPGWKFGCRDYKDYHEARYNSDYPEMYNRLK